VHVNHSACLPAALVARLSREFSIGIARYREAITNGPPRLDWLSARAIVFLSLLSECSQTSKPV